jgi:hypothetical protein
VAIGNWQSATDNVFMSDYKDKLEEWQQAAKKKVRELDEKLNLKERVGEGTKFAQDAFKGSAKFAQEAAREGAKLAQEAAILGADVVFDGAERLKEEAENLQDEKAVRERARKAAEEASRKAKEAAELFRELAGNAGEKAGEVFEGAKKTYTAASEVFSIGAHLTKASAYATQGIFKAFDWVKENPGKAALTSVSIVFGVRLGAALPGLDVVLLGSHPHWLTHSALPVYGLKKAGEKFNEYLKRQEELISKDELSKAEQERVEFERKIVKYVGAPLLGAFSCAAGAAMWAQIFQPGRITGAPISWLLGGNPFLDGIWLFANGVICFRQGYDFFMIALADQEEVQKIVREIKGLLPAATADAA